MSKFGILVGTALSALIGFAAQSAFAASPITILTDQTQMVAMANEPGTVVVGNPSIADVSVNGKQLFLHGRSFGSTNILVLDNDGNQMAAFDVSVTHDNANEVVISAWTPSASPSRVTRDSLQCSPYCFRQMIPGDLSAQPMIDVNGAKSAFAKGAKTADVNPPQVQPQ